MTDDLSARLAKIEDRLTRIEYVTGVRAQPTMVPPPRIDAQAQSQPPTNPPSSPPNVASGDDAEYVIGAKLLPRVGGVLVVLGIIYLVAWGFSTGFITKQMVFGAEVAFSGAFIYFGNRYRESKEHYGQLLTGVGFAGLYLTFVGGFTPYHLYSGNTLVGLAMAVSLTLLAISGSRSWIGLWFLGLLGGMVSSTMPLGKHDLKMALILHFIVLLSAAAVAVRMKRAEMPIILWLGSLCAFAPIFFDFAFPQEAALTATLAAGLLCMATYLLLIDDVAFGFGAAFFPILIVGTLGPAAVRIDQPQYVIGLCLGTSAMALLPKRALWKQLVVLGVLGVSTIAPWCYRTPLQTHLLVGLTAAFALGSYVIFERKGLKASLILLADASVSIIIGWDDKVWQVGSAKTILLGSILAASVLVFAAGLHYFRRRVLPPILTVGMLGVVWLYYHLVVDHLARGDMFAVSLSWGALAGVILLVGLMLKLKDMRYSSFFLMAITVVKVLFFDLQEMAQGLRVAILLVLGILMLAIGYGYINRRSSSKPV